MSRVSRRSRGVRMQLRDDEVLVLTHLADELDELLMADSPAEPEPAEPESAPGADVIAGLTWPDSDPITAPADPALLRLLPNAYPDDPEAAAEFRRYTDATLRDGMRADLDVVRAGLGVIATSGHVTLDDEQAQAWLRVLNRVRLVLATRLGIEKADDHEELDRLAEDDPRATPYLLFGWVGYVLSDLLRALG
jgi:Domain of unknown function (DUF2017)